MVITGVIYQMLFSKRLSATQWLSLLVITAGCVLKELPKLSSGGLATVELIGFGFLGVQMVSATFAGVFNEYLLKGVKVPMNLQVRPSQVSTAHTVRCLPLRGCSRRTSVCVGPTCLLASVCAAVKLRSDAACTPRRSTRALTSFRLELPALCRRPPQNIFMYTNSILVNVMVLSLGFGGTSLTSALSWSNLRAVCSPLVVLAILNSASVGIVTSMFLKHLSSVLKSIASSLEIVLTALVSFVVFGTDLGIYTCASMLCVAFGVYLYSTNPLPEQTVSPAKQQPEQPHKK